MPPRVKITKDEIVDMAMQLVRERGADAINARTIAVLAAMQLYNSLWRYASVKELFSLGMKTASGEDAAVLAERILFL